MRIKNNLQCLHAGSSYRILDVGLRKPQEPFAFEAQPAGRSSVGAPSMY